MKIKDLLPFNLEKRKVNRDWKRSRSINPQPNAIRSFL